MLKNGSAGRCARQSNGRRSVGTIRVKSQASQKQTFLAVARHCRECGERLAGVEGALHQCRKALHWPFGCSLLGASGGLPSKGKESIPNNCRIAKLSAADIAGCSSAARFEELWTFVSNDLSHSLGRPSHEELGSGRDYVLLGLRGREVLGLLWAENVT